MLPVQLGHACLARVHDLEIQRCDIVGTSDVCIVGEHQGPLLGRGVLAGDLGGPLASGHEQVGEGCSDQGPCGHAAAVVECFH